MGEWCSLSPVSYTHLDVYKRQRVSFPHLNHKSFPLLFEIQNLAGTVVMCRDESDDELLGRGGGGVGGERQGAVVSAGGRGPVRA